MSRIEPISPVSRVPRAQAVVETAEHLAPADFVRTLRDGVDKFREGTGAKEVRVVMGFETVRRLGGFTASEVGADLLRVESGGDGVRIENPALDGSNLR